MSEDGSVVEKQDSFGPYWSRTLIIKLIGLYKEQPTLWDVKHANYYMKLKRIEAWHAIATELGFPDAAVKRKITSVLGCYRRYKSRRNKRLSKGYSDEEVIPQWFGFKLLSFLDSSKSRKPANLIDIEEIKPRIRNNSGKLPAHKLPKRKHANYHYKKKDEKKKAILLKNKEKEGFYNVTTEEVVNKIAEDIELCDQYYTYGLYVANELRKYDKVTLTHVKHSINKIIFKADLKQFAENGESGDGDDPLEEFEVVYNDMNKDENNCLTIKTETNNEDSDD